MQVLDPSRAAARWPVPPHVVPNARLRGVTNGARICVAGLVLVRQRPGTAKGVIFITLEDETGIVNVIVWRAKYEEFRRAVIAGRCLKITGRLQREGPITHVVAETVEDISWMLDELVRERPVAKTVHQLCKAADQP